MRWRNVVSAQCFGYGEEDLKYANEEKDTSERTIPPAFILSRTGASLSASLELVHKRILQVFT